MIEPNMKKEDFKIEIIEQIYQNGDAKFVPNIYVECINTNKFEIFCNKFVANLFPSVKRKHYELYSYKIEFNVIYIWSHTLTPKTLNYTNGISFNSFETAMNQSTDAIDTYLMQIASKTIVETKIHKI